MLAILKYINIEQLSTMVEISGAAISAGSSPTFFANIGSDEPIIFANITVQIIDSETAAERIISFP